MSAGPENLGPSPGGSSTRRAERRAALIGLAALAFFIAGGVLLKKAASEKVARSESRCLSLLDQGLGTAPSGGAEKLSAAAACYGDLLRAKPFSTETAFRAQAATDLGAWRADPGRASRGVGSAVDERFREAFAALAGARYREAAEAFTAFEGEPGPQGALGKRYRELAEELSALAHPGR